MMECPYCRSKDFIPDVPINIVDCCGNKMFNVCCKQCGGSLEISLRRTVKLESVRPTIFDEDDWGEKPRNTKEEILNKVENSTNRQIDRIVEDVQRIDKTVFELSQKIVDLAVKLEHQKIRIDNLYEKE